MSSVQWKSATHRLEIKLDSGWAGLIGIQYSDDSQMEVNVIMPGMGGVPPKRSIACPGDIDSAINKSGTIDLGSNNSNATATFAAVPMFEMPGACTMPPIHATQFFSIGVELPTNNGDPKFNISKWLFQTPDGRSMVIVVFMEDNSGGNAGKSPRKKLLRKIRTGARHLQKALKELFSAGNP